MTITGVRPLRLEEARASTCDGGRVPSAVSVLDTTELRWFVDGVVPVDVRRWFTGTTGVGEDRCDSYLLDGRRDRGVKRRSGEALEVKLRHACDGYITLGDGVFGSLEVWRRWSPADDLVRIEPDGRWVDVAKSIVKRRFSVDGIEVPFSTGAPSIEAGCDVEIAEIVTGGRSAWSFAFAAFGPRTTRRDAVDASWRRLAAATPCVEAFGSRVGHPMGYPEWLSQAVMADAGTHCDVAGANHHRTR